MRDLVGIGWRPELAASILRHLDRIDVVEVIADDWLDAPRAGQRALETLAAQVPVALHGVGLGLASAAPVPQWRLDRMAALVARTRPVLWSEHLAFVRGGDVELGHLAAPPRTDETIDGACANLERARRTVGVAPQVENVATLIDPPGSRYREAAWLARVLDGSGADLLLDLHNLVTNAHNIGTGVDEVLGAVSPRRIAAIHIAGGRRVRASTGEVRVLDDHLHPVGSPVLDLLTQVAARAPRPLTVILERDGAYPPFEELLAELDVARAALARGRLRAAEARL